MRDLELDLAPLEWAGQCHLVSGDPTTHPSPAITEQAVTVTMNFCVFCKRASVSLPVT